MRANQLVKMYPKFTIKNFLLQQRFIFYFILYARHLIMVMMSIKMVRNPLYRVTTNVIGEVAVPNHACWNVTSCRMVAIQNILPLSSILNTKTAVAHRCRSHSVRLHGVTYRKTIIFFRLILANRIPYAHIPTGCIVSIQYC